MKKNCLPPKMQILKLSSPLKIQYLSNCTLLHSITALTNVYDDPIHTPDYHLLLLITHQFELYICSVCVHKAFFPQSKHMQIRGINDCKLPIGPSVTYHVNVWLLCDKLAACPGCFPAFIPSVCCERLLRPLNKNEKLKTINYFLCN